jgi:large subunit ribosomal protein L13
METVTHTLDARGKRLGRLASEVATILMGKNRADAVKHTIAPVEVVVEHCDGLHLEEKKKLQKTYQAYSGYPGGLRTYTLKQCIAKKGYAEVLRKAVYGMLPANRLRAPRMKRLIIREK